MQAIEQPQFPECVVIVVQRQGVDPDRELHAAPDKLRDRRHARTEPQVRTGIERDRHAAFRQEFALLRPQPDAMGQGQARRQQAQRVQMRNETARKAGIGPGALTPRFLTMHVDAPAGLGRGFGNAGEQVVRRPFQAVGTELDVDGSGFAVPRNFADHRDLLLRRWQGPRPARPQNLAVCFVQEAEDGVVLPVAQAMAVDHGNDESDGQADIAGRPAHRFCLIDEPIGALRHVAMHGRRHAGARHTGERCRCEQVGIDRRMERGGARQPDLQGIVQRTVCETAQSPPVIVGVRQCRHDEERRCAFLRRAFLQIANRAAPDPDPAVVRDRSPVGPRKQPVGEYLRCVRWRGHGRMIRLGNQVASAG